MGFLLFWGPLFKDLSKDPPPICPDQFFCLKAWDEQLACQAGVKVGDVLVSINGRKAQKWRMF